MHTATNRFRYCSALNGDCGAMVLRSKISYEELSLIGTINLSFEENFNLHVVLVTLS
jgi:hypothetical protein